MKSDENAGADDDASEEEVLTLLHCAAIEGRKEVVALLLDHGHDVNVTTNKGMTPLQALPSRASQNL